MNDSGTRVIDSSDFEDDSERSNEKGPTADTGVESNSQDLDWTRVGEDKAACSGSDSNR